MRTSNRRRLVLITGGATNPTPGRSPSTRPALALIRGSKRTRSLPVKLSTDARALIYSTIAVSVLILLANVTLH